MLGTGGRGGAERFATDVACTLPMTISLPAGRPPCAAFTRTRSAVTEACAPGGPALRLPLSDESTVSVPQSSSDVLPAPLEMSLPSARSPCTSEASVSAPAERALAPADADAVIFPATISPLKSETTIASAKDCVAAAAPGDANTAARERPMLTIEPSAGYWNDCTSAVVDVGHSRSPRTTVSCPGIVMRKRNALAPVVALRGGGAAAASVAEPTSTAAIATARRITASQGSARTSVAFSTRAVRQRRRGGRRTGGATWSPGVR